MNVIRKSLNKRTLVVFNSFEYSIKAVSTSLKILQVTGLKEDMYEARATENLLRRLTGECTARSRETATVTQTGVPLT